MIGSKLITLLPLLSTAWSLPTDHAPAYAPAPAAAHKPVTYEAAPQPWHQSNVQPVAPAQHQPVVQHSQPEPQHQPQHQPQGHDVKYGSGSQPVKDLHSCLQLCHATFGGGAPAAPPAASHAPAPPPAGHQGPPPTPVHAGGPATHTIIVAPSQGVLRFVPFSVNARQGDKLEFIWGAGPHSATLSQGQSVCNRSTTETAFDSGRLNATAKFTTTVNATTPQFHYCFVGQHCMNGMFGVVNPPTTNVTTDLTQAATRTLPAEVGSSTAGAGSNRCNGDRMDCWVATWSRSSPQASQTVSAVQKACANTGAWQWGASLDMSTLLGPGVTKENVIENVMYTRLMMSMNPEMITNSSTTTPPVIPQNFIAAPDLNTFVTQSLAAEGAPAPSGGGGPAGGPSDAYGAGGVAGASASVSPSGSAPGSDESGGVSANAGAGSTSGAGRSMSTPLSLGAGIGAVLAVLMVI